MGVVLGLGDGMGLGMTGQGWRLRLGGGQGRGQGWGGWRQRGWGVPRVGGRVRLGAVGTPQGSVLQGDEPSDSILLPQPLHKDKPGTPQTPPPPYPPPPL